MAIVSGYQKMKDYIKQSSGYKLLSRWANANTIECDDAQTVQNKIGSITGISSSLTANSTTQAASTNLTNQLYQNLSNVNVYVGDDGDLHFVNGSGADTVIPFSKSSVKIYDIKVDTDPATNVGGGTINIKNDFPNYASMTSSNFKIGITSNACGVNNGNNYHSYVRTSLSYNSSSGVLTWNTWCEGNVWWYQNIGFIVAYA